METITREHILNEMKLLAGNQYPHISNDKTLSPHKKRKRLIYQTLIDVRYKFNADLNTMLVGLKTEFLDYLEQQHPNE